MKCKALVLAVVLTLTSGISYAQSTYVSYCKYLTGEVIVVYGYVCPVGTVNIGYDD